MTRLALDIVNIYLKCHVKRASQHLRTRLIRKDCTSGLEDLKSTREKIHDKHLKQTNESGESTIFPWMSGQCIINRMGMKALASQRAEDQNLNRLKVTLHTEKYKKTSEKQR